MQRRGSVPPTSNDKERSIPVIPFVTLILLLIGVVAWVDRSANDRAKSYEAPASIPRRNFTAQELEEHPNDPPLIRAIRDDDVKTSLSLIKAGADVNQRNSEGGTPLFYSAGSLADQMLPVTEALVEHGADLNTKCGEERMTPLHSASIDGSVKSVEYLLSKGADANVRDAKGDTPLHVAAYTSYDSPLETVKVLVDHGADVNACNKEGMSVLDVIQKLRWHSTSSFLASKGAKNGS